MKQDAGNLWGMEMPAKQAFPCLKSIPFMPLKTVNYPYFCGHEYF
jgi:hypothetical protein